MNISLYPSQERALRNIDLGLGNNLLVMPTGGGKTRVIARVFADLGVKAQGKRFLFVTPTNILVEQQVKELESVLGPVVAKLTSTKPTPMERVLVSTGHLAKLFFERGLLNPQEFALVAVDEAHKALSSKHPFNYLVEKRLLILAATASLGSATKCKVLLKNLKIAKLVEGESPYDYKKEVILTQLVHPDLPLVRDILRKRLPQYRDVISVLNFKPRTFLFYDYNIMPALLKAKQRIEKEHKTLLFKFYKFFNLLYLLNSYLFQGYLTFFNHYEKVKDRFKMVGLFKELLSLKRFSPKLSYLKQLKEGTRSLTLVFFQNYQTALTFKEELEKEYMCVVLAGKSKMTQKDRDRAIKKISQEKVDFILATSMIEEGVNIRTADHIVIHNPVVDQIKWIQRKGRTGRYSDGVIETLYYKDTFEENNAKIRKEEAKV